MLGIFVQSALFSLLCLFLFWLLWLSPLTKKIEKYKVRPDLTQIEAQQLKWDLFWSAAYPFGAAFTIYWAMAGLQFLKISKVYFDFEEHGKFYYILSFVAFILILDFFRYWFHRAMHTSFLYRHFHSVHHKSIDVSPLSAVRVHPIDLVLGTPWMVATNIFPIHISIVVIFSSFYHVQNLYRHFGYHFRILPFLDRILVSPPNHELHHSRHVGNYGASLTLWDDLFGTGIDA